MVDKTIKSLSYVGSFFLIVLVFLVVYDATLRYLFSGGSIALQELEWHLFDVIFLFGIAYTLKEKSHVRVDIFYASYTQKTKALVEIITSLFFIIPFSFLLIYVSIDFVLLSFVQNEISSNPGGLHYRFILKAMMPLAFIFVILQALSDVKESFMEYKKL